MLSLSKGFTFLFLGLFLQPWASEVCAALAWVCRPTEPQHAHGGSSWWSIGDRCAGLDLHPTSACGMGPTGSKTDPLVKTCRI